MEKCCCCRKNNHGLSLNIPDINRQTSPINIPPPNPPKLERSTSIFLDTPISSRPLQKSARNNILDETEMKEIFREKIVFHKCAICESRFICQVNRHNYKKENSEMMFQSYGEPMPCGFQMLPFIRDLLLAAGLEAKEGEEAKDYYYCSKSCLQKFLNPAS